MVKRGGRVRYRCWNEYGETVLASHSFKLIRYEVQAFSKGKPGDWWIIDTDSEREVARFRNGKELPLPKGRRTNV